MNDTAARTYVEALVSGLSILTAETPADATYSLGLMALITGGEPTPEQSAELARRRTPEGAYPVPFDLDETAWAAIYPGGRRMSLLTFRVDGIPVPQGSAKAYVRGGRAIVTSANANLRPWRAAVTAAAAEARGDMPTLRTPVFVGLTFTFPRPAGHYGKKGLRKAAPEFPATRPDLDKLCRALMDSLTDAGIVADDSLVVELQATKDYGEHPGVDVTVGEA